MEVRLGQMSVQEVDEPEFVDEGRHDSVVGQ